MAQIRSGPILNEKITENTVGEFFYNQFEKNEDKIFQIQAHSGEKESYRSIKNKSVKAAIHLEKNGICSQDVAVICVHNDNFHNVIPVFALLFLGAKIVNLDPTVSQRQMTYLLENLEPTIIIVDECSAEVIENLQLRRKIKVINFTREYPDILNGELQEEFKPVRVGRHETAIMFFSSGTTGTAKTICHSHDSCLHFIYCYKHCNFQMKAIFNYRTLYWIGSFHSLIQIILGGGYRVMFNENDLETKYRIIEKYKISDFITIPADVQELSEFENAKSYDVSSVKHIIINGGQIHPTYLKKIQNIFTSSQINIGYGLTEVGFVSLFHPDRNNNSQTLRLKEGSCGQLAAGISIKVVDLEADEILGPRRKGEVRIKSRALMTSYHRLEKAENYDEEGFFKTGDIGYYDEDNYLYLVERIKDVFKYKYSHIMPSFIENILMELPAVKECAVFGVRDGDFDLPSACVVLRDSSKHTSEQEIQNFVDRNVSEVERLRGGIKFFGQLPKTPSGKIIRGRCKELFLKTN